jgi:hypothetical protein
MVAERWTSRRPVVIDPVVCSFLADHRVRGVVLLPTVLQLDVASAGTCWGSGGLRISGIQVEDPVTFPEDAARVLEVAGRAAADGRSRDLVLRSADGVTHLRATVGPLDHGGDVPSSDGSFRQVDLRGAADLVYPPMFHGPAFQVLDRFGPHRSGLVSQLASGLGRWHVHEYAGGLPTHLLELVLQTCGVWELAETGRMMRPHRIDEVVVRRQPAERAWVRVRPRGGRGPDDRVFDGVAFDAKGRELLRVRGYRPLDLGSPPDRASAGRLRAALDPTARPVQSPSDEGVLR